MVSFLIRDLIPVLALQSRDEFLIRPGLFSFGIGDIMLEYPLKEICIGIRRYRKTKAYVQRREKTPSVTDESYCRDQNKRDVDEYYRQGIREMSDTHYDRVLNGLLYGVVKLCQHRKNICQRDSVDHAAGHDQYNKNISGGENLPIQGYQPVIRNEHEPQDQKDHPYDRSLSEILSEGSEEILGDISLFVLCHLHTHIVESRERSSDGEYRNTTDNGKKIEKKQIPQLLHPPKKPIIVVEEPLHRKSYLLQPIVRVIIRLYTDFCNIC